MMKPKGTIFGLLVFGFVKLRCFGSSLLPAGLSSEEELWKEFLRQREAVSLVKMTEKQHYWDCISDKSFQTVPGCQVNRSTK
jgi:hypothetical protein